MDLKMENWLDLKREILMGANLAFWLVAEMGLHLALNLVSWMDNRGVEVREYGTEMI